MKKIGIILPQESGKPIGGFKIVYEYANRLASDGYKVIIMYLQSGDFEMQSFIMKLRMLHGFYYTSKKEFPTSKWFCFHQQIKEVRILSVTKMFVPKCDIYIATALRTSYKLNKLKVNSNKKYYFIQGYEDWGVSDEYVKESYMLRLKKIVISNWLLDIVKSCGSDAFLVPNGFDFNYFSLTNPIEKRDKMQVAFMYHTQPLKGIEMALKAFNMVKEKYPNLVVNTFSAYKQPDDLPNWYAYHNCPNKETHNAIYNNSAIFVGSSTKEGWGLTIGEAMMCGCAVACTDNKGYLEMAKDGETALISPVGDAVSLANNIIRLIEDDDLRYRIAKRGNEKIQQFDIEQSYKRMKDCLIHRHNEIW